MGDAEPGDLENGDVENDDVVVAFAPRTVRTWIATLLDDRAPAPGPARD